MPSEPARTISPDARWVGWRRKREADGGWALLPATEAATKAGAFSLCMGEELKGGELDWEYQIMPVGMVPAAGPEQRQAKQRYMTRVMRPQ